MEASAPTRAILDNQIPIRSKRSKRCKSSYQTIKAFQIIMSASTSIAALARFPFTDAALGTWLVILEGLQTLFRFHENWVRSRVTSDLLKREKHFWEVRADPNSDLDLPRAAKLFAKRLEAIVSDELSIWEKKERQKRNLK
jgi:hypothetical protein